MENKLNRIEKDFQNLAQGFQPAVSTDDIWNSIEADLPSKSKRRYFGILWFASGAMITAVVVAAFMSIGFNKEISIERQKSLPFTSFKDQLIVKDELQTNIAESNLDNLQPESVNLLKEPKSSKSIINQNYSTQKNQSKEAIEVKNNNNLILEKNINAPAIEVLKSNSLKKSYLESLSRIIVDTIDQNTRLVEEGESLIIAKVETAQIIGLPSLMISIEDDLKLLLELKPTAYEQQILPQRKQHWNWEYGLFSGVNKNYTKYSLTSNEPTRLDARFEHERGRIGSITDVRIGKRSTKGYSVFVGLGHSLIVDSYQQNERVVSQSLISGVNEIFIDNNGGMTSNTGNLLVSEIDDVDVSWNRIANNYSFVIGGSIPFAAYKNVSFGVESSFRYRFFGTTNGYYFDHDKEYITKFKTADNHPYKSSGVSQLTIGIPISYKVGAVELVLIPQYRYGINSINNNYTFYKQKNSQSGLQLGIVYRPQRERFN